MLQAVRYLLLLLLCWSWADDVVVGAVVPVGSNIAAEDDEYLATPFSMKRSHSDKHQVAAHFIAVTDCLSGRVAVPHSGANDPISSCPGFLYAFLSLQC